MDEPRAVDGPPSIGLEEDLGLPQFELVDQPNSGSGVRTVPRKPAAPASPFAPPPVPGAPPTPPPVAAPPPPPAPPPAPTLSQAADSLPGVDEFDFGDPGMGEVDLPAPAIPDLPAPAVGPGPAAPMPSHADLPAPAVGPMPGAPASPHANLPAPAVGPGMPTPISGENDLPAPVQTDIDLPAPVDLDLPTPVHSRASDSGVDLPAPADLDLPVPADLDLPTPVDVDLPQPAGMDLEPAQMGLEPAAQDLRPAGGQELQPVEVDYLEPKDTDLQPADMGLQPADQGLAPVGADGGIGAAAMAAAAAVGTSGEVEAPSRAPSPAHKGAPRTGPSRAVWIAAAGLIGVVGIGAALVFTGVLDPTEPEPVVRGAGKPSKGQPATPGAATERSGEVLAKLGADTPQGYVEALQLAEQAGDIVGKAEAALASAYRFGPNPQAVQAARGWLEEYAKQPDPFVQRVVGLGALAAGDAAGAEAALAGDDPRTGLYRGWLRLAQGRHADAADEASKLLEADPKNVAAQALAIEARATTQPEVARQLATKALEANADHPSLLLAATNAGLQSGFYKLAQSSIGKVAPADDAPPGYRARVAALRGDVASAQGNYAKALEEYDKALVVAPENVDVALNRVDTLVAARRLNDADTAVRGIAKIAPNDLRVTLRAVEIALESGEVDQARETLTAALKAAPENADVSRLAGDSYAMDLNVESAQSAYQQARKLDPAQWQAAAGEAKLLARLKKLDEALALLDAESKTASEGGRPVVAAELLTVKAELQAGANRRDDAITTLTVALDTAPTHNLAQLRRGVLRLEAGDAEGGGGDLQAIYERTGGFPGLQAPLGRRLLAQRKYDELAALVDGQIQGKDTPESLLLVGARLRLHQSKVAEAKELATIAVTRMHGDWEAHVLMSQIHIAEGDPAKALTEIKQARPGIPQAEVFLQKGKVLEYNGLWQDAPAEYREALELDPALHEARYLYGRLLIWKGRYTLAEAELKQVVETEEIKSENWYPEAWLELGRAYERVGKNSLALDALKKAQNLNDQLGEAYAIEGDILERKNSHGPAIAALTKAIALASREDKWYPRALMNLGRAQNRSGKNGAARATLQKFLEVAEANDPSRAEAMRIVEG